MISINRERATGLLLALHAAYAAKKKLFAHVSSETHAVQHINIPEGCEKGSREHVQWLFFATLTDRRQVSEEVYKAHVEIQKLHPHLYTPDVQKMTPTDVAGILIKYKVGIPRQSAEYWVRCAGTFWDMWGGDPTQLYKGGSIKAALEWKRSFKEDPLPGYGPKIMSLFGLYLAELGKVQLEDAFPVDIHVQRWFLSTDCINGINANVFNEEMEFVLRPFLTEFCIVHSILWTDLSHALWFLGNRVCTGCPKNKAVKQLCPSHDSCGGAWNSKTYFQKGFWSPVLQRFRRGGDRSFLVPVGPLFDG
jgi:endonuclease III